MRYLTQAFLILLAMSSSQAYQAFLDPGQPRQEVVLNQLQESIDKTLFEPNLVSQFEDMDPKVSLDGSFACGISGEILKDTYRCYIRLDLCSTGDWTNQITKIYKGFRFRKCSSDPIQCPKDTFIVGLNYFAEFGFGIKCKSLNSNEITEHYPTGYPFDESSSGWVEGLYKYMTSMHEIVVDQFTYKKSTGVGVKFSDYNKEAQGYYKISTVPWGTWLESKDAKPGFYACGMALRVKADSGDAVDDTTVNAIYIYYCQLADWSIRYGEYLNHGFEGEWRDDVMCPKDSFINYVKIKSIPPKGAGNGDSFDDVALNGIMISCRHRDDPKKFKNYSLDYNKEGKFPDQWTGFDDKVICGGQVRMDLTTVGDKTGVSGVNFKFCPLT